MADADEVFEGLIMKWQQAASFCAGAEEDYTKAHAQGLERSADLKTADQRNAAALSLSAPNRARRDIARIEEQAARWRVQWHLNRAGRDGRWSL